MQKDNLIATVLSSVLAFTVGAIITWFIIDGQVQEFKKNFDDYHNNTNQLLREINKKIDILEESDTSIENQTADWKTYTNTKYGFSVKYPKDLKITESSATASDDPDTILFCYEPYREKGDCVIWNINRFQNQTKAEVIDQQITNTGANIKSKKTNKENITINGVSVEKYISTSGEDWSSTSVILVKDNNIYEINDNYGGGEKFAAKDFELFYNYFKFTK